jgi:precorrin-6B methylase 2
LNACDRVRPGGSVTAFEADPDRVGSLKRNIQRNGYENVRIVQTRLDEDTEVREYCDEVDFAVIDVEGAELAALQGVPGVWDESHSLQILCEVHPSIITDETLRELYDCFDAYGFEIACAPLGGSFEHDPEDVRNELHQVYARR